MDLVKKQATEPIEYKKGFYMAVETKDEWQGRDQPTHVPSFKTQFTDYIWEQIVKSENPKEWVENYIKETPMVLNATERWQWGAFYTRKDYILRKYKAKGGKIKEPFYSKTVGSEYYITLRMFPICQITLFFDCLEEADKFYNNVILNGVVNWEVIVEALPKKQDKQQDNLKVFKARCATFDNKIGKAVQDMTVKQIKIFISQFHPDNEAGNEEIFKTLWGWFEQI